MKMPRISRPDWLLAAVITLVLLLAWLLQWSPLMMLEYKSYDLRARLRAKKPQAPVVVVAIDDASIERLGRWPWPRGYMAELISQIASSEPSLIGTTILYTEADRNSGLEEMKGLREAAVTMKAPPALLEAINQAERRLDNDTLLTEALATTGKVILPLFFTPGEQGGNADPAMPEYLKRSSREQGNPGSLLQASELAAPIPSFAEKARSLGHINILPDSDGTVRREALTFYYRGRLFPSFALQAALVHLRIAPKDISLSNGRLTAGSLSVPVDERGRMLISYCGGFGSFPTYSFFDVASGSVKPDVFKGKIVLIGPVATGIAGFTVTPFQSTYPGIEVVATVIENLLGNNAIARPGWLLWVELGAMLLFGLFLAFAMPRLKAGLSAAVTLGLLLLWNGVTLWLFAGQGIWLGMTAPTLLLAVGYTALVSSRFMVTEKRNELVESDSIETNKMLGLSFQGQGLLDLAFEKFRKCPVDDGTVRDLLYNLALDFERKRMFNKAAAVYEHILTAGEYKDIRERIATMKMAGETMIFGGPARREGTIIAGPGGSGVSAPTIGRYEIQKELGRGAMGVVYLGKDPKINRLVAIKTVRFEEVDADLLEETKKRFFREAEAAGTLNHPNIVTIYDVGEEEDLAYVAMELLDGSDLTPYVKKENLLPTKELLRIIGCVADGLAFAHDRGIVHRDIKPANIMLLKDGSVKIADFGIARIATSSATQTGTVLGTPSYMSPEQVAGQKVDGRSDLFSLGSSMYELLCGQKPFTGDSIAALMYAIANKPPVLITQIDPNIPQCCAYIAHRLMTKDLTKRYQSGREVVEHVKMCLAKLG
ncbi:CHASE2 domain-containing serine/threonine-protein kinase [Trichlorobacter ammonificans]|uniref:Non-specific serine/threonine protein kinase n=1 Tax=Trichlorobacter ammonificans TaxID=2916410 RepID=A0ABN8HIL0_9BACT|nr:serine/threonine-protein kinase [Trichlorobacter ammonificans]CAH2030843.1 Non-specific serine/threonine protein kinase [Trichlorobacter ammonificans]